MMCYRWGSFLTPTYRADKPSEDLIKLLAGDTVQLLQGITIKKKLVYVEDTSHKIILDEICRKLSLDIEIIKIGSCDKVKDISKAFKDRKIDNVYFLIDGDNKPLKLEEKRELHVNTIQLEKYCIENYLINMDVLNLYRAHDWNHQLKTFIHNINVRSKPSIKPVQIALQNGTSPFDIIDYVDGSEIFNKFAENEGKKDKKYEFMKELINSIPDGEIFTKYFPELGFINS